MSCVWADFWQSDRDVKYCNGCNSAFGLFTWRHHCRLCGFVFCDRCTTYRVLYNSSDLRCCTICWVQLHEERRPRCKWGTAKILSAPGWVDIEAEYTAKEMSQMTSCNTQMDAKENESANRNNEQAEGAAETASPNNGEESTSRTYQNNGVSRNAEEGDMFSHLTWKLVSPRTAQQRREKQKELLKEAEKLKQMKRGKGKHSTRQGSASAGHNSDDEDSYGGGGDYGSNSSYSAQEPASDLITPGLKTVYTLLINIPYTHYIYIGGIMFEAPRVRRQQHLQRKSAAILTKKIADAAVKVGIWQYQEKLDAVNEQKTSKPEKRQREPHLKGLPSNASFSFSSFQQPASNIQDLEDANRNSFSSANSVSSHFKSPGCVRQRVGSVDSEVVQRMKSPPLSTQQNAVKGGVGETTQSPLSKVTNVMGKKQHRPSAWTIRHTGEGVRDALTAYGLKLNTNSSQNTPVTSGREYHRTQDPGLTPVQLDMDPQNSCSSNSSSTRDLSYLKSPGQIILPTTDLAVGRARCSSVPSLHESRGYEYGPRETPTPRKRIGPRGIQWSIADSCDENQESGASFSFHERPQTKFSNCINGPLGTSLNWSLESIGNSITDNTECSQTKGSPFFVYSNPHHTAFLPYKSPPSLMVGDASFYVESNLSQTRKDALDAEQKHVHDKNELSVDEHQNHSHFLATTAHNSCEQTQHITSVDSQCAVNDSINEKSETLPTANFNNQNVCQTPAASISTNGVTNASPSPFSSSLSASAVSVVSPCSASSTSSALTLQTLSRVASFSPMDKPLPPLPSSPASPPAFKTNSHSNSHAARDHFPVVQKQSSSSHVHSSPKLRMPKTPLPTPPKPASRQLGVGEQSVLELQATDSESSSLPTKFLSKGTSQSSSTTCNTSTTRMTQEGYANPLLKKTEQEEQILACSAIDVCSARSTAETIESGEGDMSAQHVNESVTPSEKPKNTQQQPLGALEDIIDLIVDLPEPNMPHMSEALRNPGRSRVREGSSLHDLEDTSPDRMVACGNNELEEISASRETPSGDTNILFSSMISPRETRGITSQGLVEML